MGSVLTEAPPRADSPRGHRTGLLAAIWAKWHLLVRELAKFGVVGGVAYVLDAGLFNLFHFGWGIGPLTSKTLSTIVATTASYIGNRHWSFAHRARTGVRREYSLFFILNAVGLAISLACLGITRYVLGLDSKLALNIAGNVFGTGLGTIFRFWAYRRFVFLVEAPEHPHDTMEAIALDSRPQAERRSG